MQEELQIDLDSSSSTKVRTFFADEMEDPQFQDSRYKSARNGLYYENYIYIYMITMYIYIICV